MPALALALAVIVANADAQCNFTAAEALTPPQGLMHALTDGETIADGEALAFTCNAAINDYLSDESAQFDVTCSGTTFVDPVDSEP